MHDQEGINNSRLLVIVWNNASDEGRFRGHQHVDQVVQLILEVGADSLEVGHLGGSLGLDHHPLLSSSMSRRWKIFFFLCLSRMVRVTFDHQVAALGLLEQIHHGVVDWIPVLVQPSCQVVAHGAGVVSHGKMGVLIHK